jgi:NAD(P)-dependent dehydrogenase (short-subunit alcohol dehydrogenase family)
MSQALKDKTALITGAGSGMGRATARLFAAEGARVALVDRSAEGLAETAGLIEGDGGEALQIPADLSDLDALEGIGRQVGEAYDGRLDVLYNNAGVNRMGEVAEITREAWEDSYAVNVRAPFFLTQATLPLLRAAEEAAIVNVSSTSGIKGKRYQTAYASSKAAVVMLTKCLANDLADDGIRVLCICPGTVDTPMPGGVLDQFPEEEREGVAKLWTGGQLFQRWADPLEVARVGLFLVSSGASFMTGTIVPVDGGAMAR